MDAVVHQEAHPLIGAHRGQDAQLRRLAEHYAPTSVATCLNALRAMLRKAAPALLPNPFNDLAPKNAADQVKLRTLLTREQVELLRDLPLKALK